MKGRGSGAASSSPSWLGADTDEEEEEVEDEEEVHVYSDDDLSDDKSLTDAQRLLQAQACGTSEPHSPPAPAIHLSPTPSAP